MKFLFSGVMLAALLFVPAADAKSHPSHLSKREQKKHYVIKPYKKHKKPPKAKWGQHKRH